MDQVRNGFLMASGLISVVSSVTIAAGSAPIAGLGATVTTSRRTTPPGSDMIYRQIPGYAQLPMRFEPNVGQAPATVRYWSRGQDYTVALTDSGAIITLRQGATIGRLKGDSATAKSAAPEKQTVVRLSLSHANRHPHLRAEQPQSSVSNYFIGSDHTKWYSHVPNYAAVRYQQVYPGIDWVVYGNPQRLEYDLILAPQADPGQIRLRIAGAEPLSLNDNGDLLIGTGDKTLRQIKPVIYQNTAGGERRHIEGHYVIDHRQVSFALGRYDHNRELIIDPDFVYSTYLGGTGNDSATAIAVDFPGNAYVAGNTTSADFPTLDGFQSKMGGSNQNDIFVTKFDSGSGMPVYSTYLGGSGNDLATAIALDSSGNAYVTGNTTSTDFPTLNPFQATNHARNGYPSNAFVTKLNVGGNVLVYSTYLGGSGSQSSTQSDTANAIAVDSTGSAYIAGQTDSADFPTLNPFQATNNNGGSALGSNAFVTKLKPAGNALVYSTFLGGSISDKALGIAVDGSGNAYIVGATGSTDFPTLNPFQATNNAVVPVEYLGHNFTAFLTKLNATGTALVYSTYLGGSASETASGIAVDGAGSAYVAGTTVSNDFPTRNAFQAMNHEASNGATADAFLTKFNADGSALAYSTYLGGSGEDRASGVAVDHEGNATVVGSTRSADFPTALSLQPADNGATAGTSVAFVSQFSPTGNVFTFSTYLGGSGDVYAFDPTSLPEAIGDSANAVAVNSIGDIYVAGIAGSADFPTSKAYQNTNRAYATSHNSNAFVTKIEKVRPILVATQLPRLGGGGAIGWGLISALGLTLFVQFRPRQRRASTP
jgi:hypothetical protein